MQVKATLTVVAYTCKKYKSETAIIESTVPNTNHDVYSSDNLEQKTLFYKSMIHSLNFIFKFQ